MKDLRFNTNSGLSNHQNHPTMNKYVKNVRPMEQSFDAVGAVEL